MLCEEGLNLCSLGLRFELPCDPCDEPGDMFAGGVEAGQQLEVLLEEFPRWARGSGFGYLKGTVK